MSIKKVYKIGDTLRFDQDRYFIYEGELKGKYTKIFRIVCNKCKNSRFPNVRKCMEEGKLKVVLPTVTRSIREGSIPCGCSNKIEKIGLAMNEDLLYGYSFVTEKGSTITIKGKRVSGHRKFHCSVCSADNALFPQELEDKSHRLVEGRYNCGCSSNTKWKPFQNEIRCIRKCNEQGYKFLGYAEDYKGRKTKTSIECPEHGEYSSCSIDNLLRGRTCPSCARISRGELSGNRNGYYDHRKGEEDTLYLLDIQGNLKAGRSFNMYDRSRSIFLESGTGFKILATYKGIHEDVYMIEQRLLRAARKDHRRLFLGWTNEALTKDSVEFVEDFLKPYIQEGKLTRYLYEGKLHNTCEKEA